jgi:hypothetical protein
MRSLAIPFVLLLAIATQAQTASDLLRLTGSQIV